MFLYNLLFITGVLLTIKSSAQKDQQVDCSIRYSIGALTTKPNIKLKGHRKEFLSTLSYTQCSLRCIEKDWCISVNYKISQKKGQCELNVYGVESEFYVSEENQDFEISEGFVYSQFRPPQFGCHNNPCSNGGTCLVNCKDSQKTECICKNGFRGIRCKEVDECASNPCQNGGTCSDKNNAYTCTCVPGYHGTHCEHETDECLSKPCLKNGTCTDKVNGYLCSCPSGFSGENCQYDSCDVLPCKNGATCSLSGTSFSCLCASGFKGITCDVVDSVECTSYRNITDLTRNVNYGRVDKVCDSISFSGWYRLTGDAGNVMPSKCIPKNRCNTDASGWLKSPHPTIQEGIKTKRVCFTWGDNCCKWYIDIRVRNCGVYFVYEFKKLYRCYLRYCGTK